jgi:allantoate deiminase
MLFLRTPRGLSHHPDESVSYEDVEAALNACQKFLDSIPNFFRSVVVFSPQT